MAEEKEKSEETFKVNTGDEEKTVEVEQDFDTPEDGSVVFDSTTGKGMEGMEIPDKMRAPVFEDGKKVKIFMNEKYGFPHSIQITAAIANHKPQLVGKPSEVEKYEINEDDIVIEVAGEIVFKASEDGFPDTQRGPEWVSEILSKTIETEEEKVEPEILN